MCRDTPILTYTRRYRMRREGPPRRGPVSGWMLHRERYDDAVMTGASEKERTTGGHIWSRGPRGSQVTPASDGASRFHDDVLRVSLFPSLSLSSLYLGVLFHLFSPLFDAVFLAHARLLRAGHQKYRRLFRGWERRGGPREKNRREALFRDYRGLPAFWNRADRLHSQYRVCSLISGSCLFAISKSYRSDLSSFSRGVIEANTRIIEVNATLFTLLE